MAGPRPAMTVYRSAGTVMLASMGLVSGIGPGHDGMTSQCERPLV